jgi:hypothetical protein
MPKRTRKQLLEWARSQRYTDKELFTADGKEDWCEQCGDGERPGEIVHARKGMPMVCYRSSYEYEEYDTKCLQCLYDDWHFWENVSDEEIQKMLRTDNPDAAQTT